MQYWLLMLVMLCISSHSLSKERIISLGHDVTEIIFALKFGKNIIARESSDLIQLFPQQYETIGNIKKIDYQHLISMEPTLVFASDQAKPSSALLLLQNKGIPVINITRGVTLEAIPEKIKLIAKHLERNQLGKKLIKNFQNELAQINTTPLDKKVLFIINKGGVLPLTAGANTTADKLITAVGAKNIMATSKRYQPLSPESIIARQPDLIIVCHESAKTLGGAEGIWRLPGMSMTPAGKSKSLVVVDETGMLHFSLGTPKVMAQIRQALEKLPE